MRSLFRHCGRLKWPHRDSKSAIHTCGLLAKLPIYFSVLLRNELNSCWHVVGGKDRCSQARVLVPVAPVETRKCLASAVEGKVSGL